MDDDGSLLQMPRDACVHRNPRDDCVDEDPEFIGLWWLVNATLDPSKNGARCSLQVGLREWDAHGTSPSKIQHGLCETPTEVMDAELEGKDVLHPSRRPGVAEPAPVRAPPKAEPEMPRRELPNPVFVVNDFYRPSPNPVVATIFREYRRGSGQQLGEDIPS